MFSKQNFLSEDVMQATLASKKEYAQILAEIGFVSQQYVDKVCIPILPNLTLVTRYFLCLLLLLFKCPFRLSKKDSRLTMNSMNLIENQEKKHMSLL